MKNPLVNLFNALPEDGSKVIVTKEFCVQILAWMRGADPKFAQLDAVDKLLWYLHQQNAVTLSYTEVGKDRINFIQRNLNGNQSS